MWTQIANWSANWLDRFKKAPPTLLLPFLASSLVAAILIAVGNAMARSIKADATFQLIVQLTAYILAAAFALFSLLHLWFALIWTYQWLQGSLLLEKAKVNQAIASLGEETAESKSHTATYNAAESHDLRSAAQDDVAAARFEAERALWVKLREAITRLPSRAFNDPAVRMIAGALSSSSNRPGLSPPSGFPTNVVDADAVDPAQLIGQLTKYRRHELMKRLAVSFVLLVVVALSGVTLLSPIGQHVGMSCRLFCK